MSKECFYDTRADGVRPVTDVDEIQILISRISHCEERITALAAMVMEITHLLYDIGSLVNPPERAQDHEKPAEEEE